MSRRCGVRVGRLSILSLAERIGQPNEGFISEQRIKALKQQSTDKLRSWLLHINHIQTIEKRDMMATVRDVVYIICERRMSSGELDSPEESWLRDNGFSLPC